MSDDTGTLLHVVAHRRWSKEMLQAAGIDERLLPSLHESPDVCGKISSNGAAATGLRVGTPVVAGAGRQTPRPPRPGIVLARNGRPPLRTPPPLFSPPPPPPAPPPRPNPPNSPPVPMAFSGRPI